jgi:crotonobetainyl-CoA:carnitine CoA-transferase CaiB-like acyl-CoA transferase
LQDCGARVIKVESQQRPDGTRRGKRSFFDCLNAGKYSVSLPLHTDIGRSQLRSLLEKADVVIESSRPRALKQMGIDSQELVQSCPGLTWISITGYGRQLPQADWVAFGDDAGVAGGLTQSLSEFCRETVFCADAIADPLSGLHAALLAWKGLLSGGGLYAVSMRDVVANCATFLPEGEEADWGERLIEWQRVLHDSDMPVMRPAVGLLPKPSRLLGADTADVLTALEIAC